MRECKDDVRLGMTKLSSSLLVGRPDSPERGREVKEGAIMTVDPVVESSAVNGFLRRLRGCITLMQEENS